MERLGFGGGAQYSATETAIHLARYQLAVPYCAGKRVLDIACGEGYGSQFLISAGAKQVDAVDASPEAVDAARRYFSSDAIKHHVYDAHRVSELFPAETFDVVVSIETIEHLTDPARFLREISAVAKKDATIIITCPNDNLYYPNDSQFNKHHVRKYSFQDFRLIAMEVLGDDVRWGYGAPVIGFRNFGIEWSDRFDAPDYRSVVLGVRENGTEMVLPVERHSQPHPAQSCYFIGVWNGNQQALTGSAVYPVAMEALERQAFLVSWHADKPHPDTFRALIDEQRRRIELMTAEQSLLQGERLQLTASLAALEARTAVLAADAEQSKAAHREILNKLTAELAEVQSAIEAKRQSADAYRVQAMALKKEIDLVVGQVEVWRAIAEEKDAALSMAKQSHADVAARQGEAGAEIERLRGELVSRQTEADTELVRLRDECASTLIEAEAALIELRAELVARQADSDGHRVQAFALAKEVAVLTSNALGLSAQVAELKFARQAEVEAQFIAQSSAADAERAAEVVDVQLRAEADATAGLHAVLNEVRQDADRYRVQAFALSKEVEILAGRVAALSVERNRALSVPGSAVGDLLRENEALERRVNALLLVAGSGTGGLKAQIVRSGKYRLRRAGIAVRPMLPPSVLSVAMRVARKLNL